MGYVIQPSLLLGRRDGAVVKLTSAALLFTNKK